MQADSDWNWGDIVITPANPDDSGWGLVGSALGDWLTAAFGYVQRAVQRVLSEYELVTTAHLSAVDEPAGSNAVLIAVLALVVALGALAVVARPRLRATGWLTPTGKAERSTRPSA